MHGWMLPSVPVKESLHQHGERCSRQLLHRHILACHHWYRGHQIGSGKICDAQHPALGVSVSREELHRLGNCHIIAWVFGAARWVKVLLRTSTIPSPACPKHNSAVLVPCHTIARPLCDPNVDAYFWDSAYDNRTAKHNSGMLAPRQQVDLYKRIVGLGGHSPSAFFHTTVSHTVFILVPPICHRAFTFERPRHPRLWHSRVRPDQTYIEIKRTKRYYVLL